MRFRHIQPIHKMMAVLVAVLFALCSMGIGQPAYARGGGGGGGGGGGHSSPAPASHASSSSGRSTSAPKSSSSSGRSTKAPAKTGSNAPKSVAKPTASASKPVAKATAGRVTVSKTTRVTGSSYTAGGHTYTYRSTTYYSTFHGGYPLYGTSSYWLLYNDPFYYANYGLVGNPWYGHQYPVGYSVQNGQFVQQGGSLAWLWIVLLVLVVGGVVTYVIIRRRNGRTFADKL